MLRGGPVSHHGDRYDVAAELRPQSVQQPRPPIWVAAVAPYRRPLARAQRWDGVVPIAMPEGYMTPDEVASFLDGVDRPGGWGVVVNGAPGIPTDEYVDARRHVAHRWHVARRRLGP
jgi:hypothetical protein